MKKVFIKTFGCQMNSYDSEKIVSILEEKKDFIKTNHIEKADIIFLNTCSVREKAEEKVFSDLGKARKLKEKKPQILIGVGGCVASQEGKKILERAPFVDLIFGPQTIHRIPDLINRRKVTNKPQIDISFPEIEKFDELPTPKPSKPTAFVSIMEGCSKYCSFCIVPYTRGEEISRPIEDILTEIASLIDDGVREINLLGQNVNSYKYKSLSKISYNFADLLNVVSEFEGLERIRFTTSHPKDFNDRLIEEFASNKKLVNHLHLPVQAGSNRVLTLMKRGYLAEDYIKIADNLRKIRPNISISSDFIVGFPGETFDDFNETLKLIERVHFDNSFSFIYSARPGTPASSFKDNVSLETKKERLRQLQLKIIENTQNISKNMIMTKQKILVEGISKKNSNEIFGRTENNRVVNLPGNVASIGKIIEVLITNSLPNSLRGRQLN